MVSGHCFSNSFWKKNSNKTYFLKLTLVNYLPFANELITLLNKELDTYE